MLLGAGGFFVGGPVQYAGTTYTVCEYTYEYTVNDKNPGEVLKDKIAWLMPKNEENRVEQRRATEQEAPGLRPAPQEPASRLSTAFLPKPVASLSEHRSRLRITENDQPAIPGPEPRKRATLRPTAMTPSSTPQKTGIRTKKTAGPSQQSDRPPQNSSRQFVFSTNAPPPSTSALRQQRQREFPILDNRLLEAAETYRIQLPQKHEGINGAWEIRHAIDEQPLPLLS
jgi:hypothetical protein